MAERGRTCDDEITVLLQLWGEESIQWQLLGAVRSVVRYRAIATLLAERGYIHTYKQCWEKIKALKKKYKEMMDRQLVV